MPLPNDPWWNLGWWFPELIALFLVASVVVGLVAGFGEKQITGNIVRGFGDFIGAGVAVVLARGVTVILNNTQTIDTILSWMEDAVSGTSAVAFIGLVVLINTGIAFIIPSSSGHATLAMPLLAPLGDFADVSRPLVVTAWSWGAGSRAVHHADERRRDGRPRARGRPLRQVDPVHAPADGRPPRRQPGHARHRRGARVTRVSD